MVRAQSWQFGEKENFSEAAGLQMEDEVIFVYRETAKKIKQRPLSIIFNLCISNLAGISFKICWKMKVSN